MNQARVMSTGGLIATSLILIFLSASCATTPQARDAQTTQEPFPASIAPEKKASVRTIGVVAGGSPAFTMRAHEKEQVADVAGGALWGGLVGFGTGYLGAVLLGETVLFPLSLQYPDTIAAASVSHFLTEILLATALGSGVGVILAVAKTAPAKRTDEIDAAVLPALSIFPFQESTVEEILAAGTNDTGFSFLDLNRTDSYDAVLTASVLDVGLRKAENSLALTAVVRARLTERDTGAPLAERTFSHVWRTFGGNKPAAGDEPLTREEIDGCLHLLSEDIVDTLFLVEDFPALFCAGVSGPPLFRYSDALQPKFPKSEYGFFETKWKSGKADSLQPRMEWSPFPGTLDRTMDREGSLKDLEQVSYDLRIWKLAEKMHHPPELVYERRGLADPWHTVEQPLEYGKTYYWAVRARFVRNGRPAATQWTTLPGFVPLITREGTLADHFSSQVSGMYRFTTPAE